MLFLLVLVVVVTPIFVLIVAEDGVPVFDSGVSFGAISIVDPNVVHAHEHTHFYGYVLGH